MTPFHKSLWQLNIAVVLFGFAGLFGKFLVLPALIIVLGRTVFGALALWGTLRLGRQSLRIATLRGRAMLLALGAILAIHWFTFFHSIQISTVAVGLLTYSTFPLFVTFLEPWLFGEKLRGIDVLTALFVLGGLVLIIPDFDFGNNITRGAFWGTLSGLSFAFLAMLNRKFVQSHPPLLMAFYQNGFAALVLLPFAFLIPWHLGERDLLLLIVLGVFCTALSHALYISSLRRVRTQLASIISSLEPVYGIALAFLMLQETPSLRTLAGGAVILGTTLVALRYRA